ncbi:methylated-DNA--[protein]-cysteine S-methyltransferase [Exilibacterium tricleocarpae]|uniref:Methylated-DNA--[protein]-cysteine S-methyltransferase n=1 Tax=Exilibacterium tricleocarpae TaxID=2591008 RepID=A0A545TNW5_9GAMM|nr:methylated-DNA--[protein]-cysteine S-methyltransferase [Exilibacterium tricleocarpae]TQV78915.1 methylated-DNA--[protein]-cysteine S-methyltransferase [Exilibacterium tricleocarpae]
MPTYGTLFPTPVGDCGIAWYGDKVIATCLPEVASAATAARLTARTGSKWGEPPARIRRAIRSITGLLEGKRTDLSFIVCDFSGVGPFPKKVYAATRTIPAGETLTYGDIASRLGDKLLARKVGQVLGRNPFPIIVPCHRVIGANGRLTGFSAHGGTETKLKLLTIEGASIGEQQGLFGHLPMAAKPRR